MTLQRRIEKRQQSPRRGAPMIGCALQREERKDERHCYHVTSVTAVAGRRPLELRAGRFLLSYFYYSISTRDGRYYCWSCSIHAP